MQITLDSSEPLDRVLTVVGALYGVELSAGNEDGAGAAGTQAVDRQPTTDSDVRTPSSARNRRTGRTRRGRTAAATSGNGRVSQSLVRAWAQEQGLQVSTRGPLPKSVMEAYQAATTG